MRRDSAAGDCHLLGLRLNRAPGCSFLLTGRNILCSAHRFPSVWFPEETPRPAHGKRPRFGARCRRLRTEALEARLLLAEFTVGPGGDYSTIQAAINAARDNSGEDTVIVPPGTYNNSLAIDDYSGALTLRSSTGKPADVTINGGGSNVVSANLTYGFAVTVEGVTLAGGGAHDDATGATPKFFALGEDQPADRGKREFAN